ncbi:MAG: CvpA family protein [Burkholderiaceae bacterium]
MSDWAIPSFTSWDAFVVLVILLSVLLGLFRGLVRTVFALASWILALLGVPLALAWWGDWLPTGWPRPLLAVLVFLAVFIAVRVLGTLAARTLQGIGLGFVDRLLGAVLGIARALLVVLVVALPAHLMGYSRQPEWQQSWSRPLLDALVKWVEPWVPENLSGVRRT